MQFNISKLILNPIEKIEYEKLLEENKDDLLENLKKSKNDIIAMSDLAVSVIQHAECQTNHTVKWKSIIKIWNVSGYILLATLDLKTYLEILCTLSDNLQRITVARNVFTQLYEISRDLDFLTNVKFTNEMEKMKLGDLKNELYEKRKNLKKLAKDYEKELKDIRINVGAHRNNNYKDFHQYICNLEYTSCIRLICLFGTAIDDLASTIQKIMVRSTQVIVNL